MKPVLLAAALAAAVVLPAAAFPAAMPTATASPTAAPPRDVEAALRTIVEGGALAGARVGVLAVGLDTGKVVFAKDPDVLLNPASNVKLFTTAAALVRLGPEYRFDTEFYVDAASAGHASVRTLYVRGKGDPTLVSERLWQIAGELEHLGIARVGEIVLDDGFFDDDRIGPGFDQEDGDRSYLAPTGAISLNFNTVEIHVAPGDRRGARARVEVEPESSFFEIENRVTTVGARGARRVTPSSEARPGRQRIVVSGRVPAGGRPQVVWRKIDDPLAYFGHTLKRLLELRGVKVAGKVRAGALPAGARLVYVSQSESLGDVVRRLNKSSNNFTAEQILKTLGAEAKGTPGSFAKGVEAVEAFLAEIGVPRGSYVMKNGSGLNDANRFSARQTVTLLRAMRARRTVWPEYLSSLPVAGRDGTMRWRMESPETAGRVRAKTGTLENVTSLSGYVEPASGEPVAFSIFVNDLAHRTPAAVRAVDAVASALAAAGGPPAELSAAVAMASPPAAPAGAAAPPAQLQAAVRTYYDLGREGDRRNVTFLRSALRAESEPALRMAIGECVYLSDPDGDASRRAFLDALDAAALPRLLAAAPEGLVPVLPSLSDLAADGNAEALSRLLDLGPAAAEAPLADAWADALAEVAGADPDGFVDALAASLAPQADAAVAALARGLARAEPDHPFRAALAAAAARDGDAGAFARALRARLDDATAAARAPRVGPAPEVVPARAPAPSPGG